MSSISNYPLFALVERLVECPSSSTLTPTLSLIRKGIFTLTPALSPQGRGSL
jgi:hypothetical protein